MIFLISIFIIELLFFILGYNYLYQKKGLNKTIKYILNLFFYSAIILFNIVTIKILDYNYFENRENNITIKILEKEINSNKETIKKLDEIKIKLNENIDNTQYMKLKTESEELEKEISDLTLTIEVLTNEKENKNNELDTLKKEYEILEAKTEYKIKDFPTYNQFPNYPNGCESVALYLMLKYHNVDITVENIVEKLKKGDAPFRKNGTLYSGDPEVEFVGDPRLKSGYGVYEGPILDVAKTFKSGIKNITGSSLNDVLSIVSKGLPVQVWASINLRNTYICAKWQSTSTDRIVEWKCGLHSLVIIGYTYNKIITSDPYTGSIEYYSKTQFEKMYNTYGKRAIYYEA